MRTAAFRFSPRRFIARFLADRRGVSAVAFAITFAVLAPMSLGVLDIFTMTQQQGKLQDALDAAALYAARSTATDNATINTIGSKALGANLSLIPGAALQSASFTLVTNAGDTKVTATAQVSLPAYAPLEFTHNPITVNSEVTRPGNNLEVALVVDNTGSMAGAPLSSLQPAAYGTEKLIKAVILMTDGAFNTAYCKGVVSGPSSAQDGSAGANNTHAACASPNADSFTQAQTLCNNMKAAPYNVVIYTVAFLHGGNDPQAQAILANCATDASHAYVPSTGASLQVAFQSIAADLNKLRISK